MNTALGIHCSITVGVNSGAHFFHSITGLLSGPTVFGVCSDGEDLVDSEYPDEVDFIFNVVHYLVLT